MENAIRSNTMEILTKNMSKNMSKTMMAGYIGTMANIVKDIIPEMQKDLWIGNYHITINIH